MVTGLGLKCFPVLLCSLLDSKKIKKAHTDNENF